MSRNKVSVLERMGLVRSVEQPEEVPEVTVDNRLFEEEAQMHQSATEYEEVQDPSQLLQVAAIYEKAGLLTAEQPVFKMAEVLESLPQELSTRQKREITVKLLNTMHLKVEDVITDGHMRLTALADAEKMYEEEAKGNLADFKERIKALEAQIDELKEMSAITEKMNEAEAALIDEEADKVNGLLLFINEGSEKL